MCKNKSALFFIMAMLITAVCVNTGCEPLRKKFVRKKKQEKKDEFIPVLEPIDYQAQAVSPQEQYKYHFALWRVWEKELLIALQDRSSSDKRQEYLINQMLIQMESMGKWITTEKREFLIKQIAKMRSIQQEIQKPAQLRDYSGLINRLRVLEKNIYKELSPANLADSFIQL